MPAADITGRLGTDAGGALAEFGDDSTGVSPNCSSGSRPRPTTGAARTGPEPTVAAAGP
jgi:hypothetical protein